jgi:hypothetical protein
MTIENPNEFLEERIGRILLDVANGEYDSTPTPIRPAVEALAAAMDIAYESDDLADGYFEDLLYCQNQLIENYLTREAQ